MFATKVRAARDARTSATKGAAAAASSSSAAAASEQRWRPWAEGTAPVRWDDSDTHATVETFANVSMGTQLRSADARWELGSDGKHKFRADFEAHVTHKGCPLDDHPLPRGSRV